MGKRIVIVGAGAVGGYTGAHMAQAGEDVTFVDAWPENVAEIKKNGLRITHHQGPEPFAAKPRALHLTEAQQLAKEAPVDIAFICTKSYDTQWAALLIRQYLAPGGYVVSLQNCMNEAAIAEIVGWGKVLGCIASNISVGLIEPGHVHRGGIRGVDRGHTVYRTGEVHGRITERAQEVYRLVSHADSAKVTDNLWGERWSKLVTNSMANGVSACTGLSGAQMAQNEAIRRFQARLGGEAIRIGQALGYKLEEIGHLCRRKSSPAPARATGTRWRAMRSMSARNRAARPSSARRWARTWRKAAAPRSSSSTVLSCARARGSGSRRAPMSGWSTSSRRSSVASSSRIPATSRNCG